ncbi:unnamed protein product [Rhizoctonia solani]|uniref:Inhibitor I9 domain-containing protein n=1 Tax=Rhizoctonia solani TaxID=456999 RepID=A0A8H3D8M3_9AGAM|nr:unnamed protein product [Rhizoctonia solani]
MKCYVVVFKESATKEEIEDYINRVQESGGKIKYDYSDLMKAMAVYVPHVSVQSFTNDPIVDSMEPDGVATTQD